ncbi:MAG TPA: phenylacetate--CoA ligase family protein, partial [Polyangiaceae bacterium]|nr:phenylacetate--CoA ligase family protein [Polyangiaceae bacterium]
MTDSVPPREHAKSARAVEALTQFYGTPLDAALTRCLSLDPGEHALELFRCAAERVPAYRRFLAAHGVEAEHVRRLVDFRRLPVTTKETYHRPNALADLCLDGNLAGCDMLAVSSGSTGEPSVWPRFVADELGSAERFEQVLADAFGADQRSTLVVVCFALGTWVGGMYTTACCRHVAAKGYPITVVTPGTQKPEILRVLRSLAPLYEQIVLCGYPPFLKDLIDEGKRSDFPWARHAVRLVMAGEVFSESWRTLVSERLGATDPAHASASLYGTADGGVLANETPLSITIRRFLAERPGAARELFGDTRLPTLCQYDPLHRYFEREEDGSLLFSADGSVPLVRYKILDRGGVISYAQMIAFLTEQGFSPEVSPVRELPFVYVFGRSSFAVSFYGANVYPENVAPVLEQEPFAA